jgi:hypothetical protein
MAWKSTRRGARAQGGVMMSTTQVVRKYSKSLSLILRRRLRVIALKCKRRKGLSEGGRSADRLLKRCSWHAVPPVRIL